MSGSVDPSQGAGIGGVQPTAQTQNPMLQGLIQRYASMPTEKLTELSAMMGGSSQGQLIQRLLQQRRVMPQQNQPPQQQAAQPGMAPTAPVQQRHGGATPKRAGGGSMLGVPLSSADPWWTKQEAYSADKPAAGYLSGSTPGRADAIKTQAPGGSYVVPADVIAGLGDGNSLAGARVMDAIVQSGPHGIPQERMGRGAGPPRAPAPYREQQAAGGVTRRAGGVSGQGEGTPVALSHGEYVVHPEHVVRIGGGNLRRGHRILDQFVIHMRKHQIKTLKSLPGPVGAKK
jgi:hypothetical protein